MHCYQTFAATALVSRIIDRLEGAERFLHPAAVADWMETRGIVIEDVLEPDSAAHIAVQQCRNLGLQGFAVCREYFFDHEAPGFHPVGDRGRVQETLRAFQPVDDAGHQRGGGEGLIAMHVVHLHYPV